MAIAIMIIITIKITKKTSGTSYNGQARCWKRIKTRNSVVGNGFGMPNVLCNWYMGILQNYVNGFVKNREPTGDDTLYQHYYYNSSVSLVMYVFIA